MRPIKNRSAATLTEAIRDIHDTLAQGGCKPKFHRLDNECPAQVKEFFKEREVTYQLAPPDDHRTNAAERAIRTAKNHLAAGWWSMDKKFPMHLWDKTIPHAELTLNLMRGSRINPKLSAWEQLHGRYDFNATPIAPPGIKVLAHAKATKRQTWATHAFEAWYIGPALEHYRCHTVWTIKTRQVRIVNQLVWFPPQAFPKLTNADLLRATIEDLKTILINPPTDTYVGHMEQSQRGVLIDLQNLLHSHVQPTDTTRTPDATLLGVPYSETTVLSRPNTRSSNSIPKVQPGYMATNPDTGKPAEYKELKNSSDGDRWTMAFCKEWGRLFQGYKSKNGEHDIEGTNTCHLTHRKDIPSNKKPTYIRTCADYREQKADPYRIRCTAGGNLINYPGDKSTRTADLTTFKCLANNVISTPGARAACIDLKDFYLNSTLPDPEYVRFRIDLIPTEIRNQYDIQKYANDDGCVYARLEKGMYGLPQAGKVANDQLLPRLAAAGYNETGVVPGLFKHEKNSIIFCLVVDDFFVQYTSLDDLHHLSTTLKKNYEITLDMEAKKFCGITLDWNYEEGHVTLSMPGYVEKALQRFTHPPHQKPEHSPHPWTQPDYGAKIQYTTPEDTSDPLDQHGIKRLQEIVGTFLFYGRAVDNTMLVALGTVAAAQTHGTETTMDTVVQLLNYAATHPDAAIRFYGSDMILYVHSDASYLSEPNARSRVGGYFYLGNKTEPPEKAKPNGPIHVESRIMKHVMAAASEAEVGALFHNGQEAAHIRNILREIGREQLAPTRITTDNSTADGFANKRIKIKRSKAMDMRFFWIQDRVQQGHFSVHWLRGEHNHGDYFTKHHPTSHHIKMRPIYLHTGNLANGITPDCRGVLIRDPESLASQSDGWLAATQSSQANSGCLEQHTFSPVCTSCCS
jgi:Reverse transcriptase (RNA-dependent DNA polymerase)